MNDMQQYTVESFTTGERRTVTAAHWWDALTDQPEPCFTVIRKPNGKYAAVSLENDAFPIPGEVAADTPEAAAEGIRKRYKAIKAAA